MISKEMAHIDWSKTTAEISKLICGMNSWPMAFAYYKGEPFKVISAVKGDAVSGEIGEIIEFDKEKGLRVKTSDGSIYITVAQFPNSRRMTVDEYLRGHSIEFGTILN